MTAHILSARNDIKNKSLLKELIYTYRILLTLNIFECGLSQPIAAKTLPADDSVVYCNF